jgi:hypothetical protein
MAHFKFLFGLSASLFTLCFSCKQQPVFSQSQQVFDLVKDFGAKGDDKTDNYTAFINAASAISKAGGGKLVIPTGKYYIAAYKGQEGVTDIIFRNCKGLTIEGNNSVVRVNGNFRRNADYKLPNLPYKYAYNNTVCPFKLVNCSNVLLKDITIYGEVDKMQKQPGVVEGESYGVFIADNEPADRSSRIVLQNITAHRFAADGFLIKVNGDDIVLDRCRSFNNARQGLSIVKGSNIRILNSVFDSTGKTGAYGWHAPGAGIDVENEFGPGKLKNVLIRNCQVRGNNGFQIVTTLPSDKVVIDSCFISDLSAGYSSALNGLGIYSINSVISNSILFAGIQVDNADQIYRGPLVQEINNNIIYSGNRGIVSASFSRPVNITGNIFIMLPKPDLTTYFPYVQNGNARFNHNVIVVHADRIKKDPNQVTALVQSAKESIENFWLMNGYEIPAEKRKAHFYLPAMNDTKVVKNQFFQASDQIARYDFKRTIFLTDAQVKTILDKEIFTAYKQNAFNKKFIQQAGEVRSFTKHIAAAAE